MECQRRHQERMCFYCGSSQHQVAQCASHYRAKFSRPHLSEPPPHLAPHLTESSSVSFSPKVCATHSDHTLRQCIFCYSSDRFWVIGNFTDRLPSRKTPTTPTTSATPPQSPSPGQWTHQRGSVRHCTKPMTSGLTPCTTRTSHSSSPSPPSSQWCWASCGCRPMTLNSPGSCASSCTGQPTANRPNPPSVDIVSTTIESSEPQAHMEIPPEYQREFMSLVEPKPVGSHRIIPIIVPSGY